MRRLSLMFAMSLLALSGRALAQSNARELAEANRTAMDAFNNLDIEAAKATLEQAIAAAESSGLNGSGLARTYANLGVIEIGGFSNSAAALEAFITALREDPSVEPDPLVSTPEVVQVFNQAKRKAGQGGGGGRSKPGPTPPPPAVVEGNLEHQPAAEQLANTPIPIFVASTDPEIKSAKIFYRSIGMKQPKSATMQHRDDGFSFLLPCGDVFAPTVEYFVVAYDAGGKKVGNAGTPENPVSVPIVRVRTQPAPSLPGQVPPSQCGAGGVAAAGAGMADPEAGDGAEPETETAPASTFSSSYGSSREGSLGDTCSSDSQCGEGLVCFDNFCAMGTRKDEEEDEDSGDAPKFYFDLGIGLGAAYVSNGMNAEPAPFSVMKAGQDAANTVQPNGDPSVAATTAKKQGWDCTVTGSKQAGYTYDACKVMVNSSGFVSMPVLNAAVGLYVTPRLGLSLAARLQFGHGGGSWAGLTLIPRAEILLTAPAATGFHAGLLAGLAFGPIQAQVPKQAGATTAPYATSGTVGAQGGLRVGYRFSRNFGLVLTPVANLMFNGFLFDVDVTAGAQVSF